MSPAGECVIEGSGDAIAHELLLFALPDKSSPIAFVARAEDVGARITLLPNSAFAAMVLRSPDVELEGFVARDDLHFVTRSRVPLLGSQLFVERGRFVAVRAIDGDRVTAEVPSPFEEAPTSIQISCENLAYDDGVAGPLRSATVGWAAPRSSGPIALYDGPSGALLLRAEPDEPMRVLESREGFTHVSIGDVNPWCEQGVTADVWVLSSDIAPRAEPPDVDDACTSIRDGSDRCPGARIAKRTELWLGDPATPDGDLTHIGWLKQGGELMTRGKARDRFIEIQLNDQLITAPPKLAFFAERAAITGDCVPSIDDDGCPCGAP